MFSILLSAALAASPKAAPASKTTQMVLDVKPATVQIYVDDKKIGKATKVWTLTVKPGDHRLKLVTKISSQEEVVTIKQGEKTNLKYDLTDSGDRSNAEPVNPSETAEPPSKE